MYHRIVDPASFSYPIQAGMFVTPKTFRKQMQYLADHAAVVSLDDLATMLAEGKRPSPRTVAITFDDGWSDNYFNALPILCARKLPATVFTATGLMETRDPFWTDLLGLLLVFLERNADSAVLPEVLSSCHSLLGDFAARQWEEILRSSSNRSDKHEALIRNAAVQPLLQRQRLFGAIRSILPADLLSEADESFLSWTQIEEMAQNGFSFGSHTHSHSLLTELDPHTAEQELAVSYSALTLHNITPSRVFCYPAGAYSASTQQILCREKVSAALSTEKSSHLEEHPMLLGRIGIHEDISSTIALFTARIWGEKYF